MDFVQYIKDNGLGTVIGEPPGNSPNGCGEIMVSKCPNSSVVFLVSARQWQRINRNNTDLLIQPDIICGQAEAVDKLMELLRTKRL